MRRSLILLTPLLLTACVNETASYTINGNTHALSLLAQQPYVWDEEVNLALIASRLPECQRRIPLSKVALSELDVELFSSGDNAWTLRQGKQLWRVQTDSCGALGDADKVPLGAKLGAFKMQESKLVFEAAAAPAVPVAPGPEAPAAAPATN
jgi:hypothetical protein